MMDMEEQNEESKTFEDLGLCKQLVAACDRLGWKTPTGIQAHTIPHALQGKDLIGLSLTGSGKTGAFALPILELAIQIGEQFKALGANIRVNCAVLVGGMGMMAQYKELARIPRPNIIVATPGRLIDLLNNSKGFSLRNLSHAMVATISPAIDKQVLDEADRLLSDEFEKSLDEILNVIPRDRRTYLFSATMTKKVNKLQRACLRNPIKIEAASKYATVDSLKQQFCLMHAQQKDVYLVYILSTCPTWTMVFMRTCDTTRFMALVLSNLGFKAVPITGHMSQAKRLGALNLFKSGQYNILVCTDVASRGLDIPSVDMVINYDIPSNSKDYIHRVGRTARAGRSGVAISLVNQYEVEWFKQVEKLIGKHLSIYPTEEKEVLLFSEKVAHATRVALAKIKDGIGKKRKGDDDVKVEKYIGQRYTFSSKSRRR